MASQDEVLRLAAEVVDKWSGPLAEMRRSFIRMEDQLKNAHKHGREEATKHRTAVLDLHKAFERIDGTLKTSFVPTVAAMGVTVLSVGGAIEALKNTLLGFGESTRALTYLGRETGVAIDQLRAFDALARRLGTSPDAMNAGIQQFAQHMHDLRNLVPAELNAWKQTVNPGLNSFVQSLSRLPVGEALSKAIGELSAIPDQQEKRRYLRMLGLPESLADVPVDHLRAIMADIRKNIGELGPDAQKKALDFQNSIERLGDAIERLKLDVGSGLADSFTRGIESMRAFINENRDNLIPALKEVGGALRSIAGDLKKIFDLYQQYKSGKSGGIKDFLLGPKGEPGLRTWWDSAVGAVDATRGVMNRWNGSWIDLLPNAQPGGPQPLGGGDLGLNQFNMPGGALDWSKQKNPLFHKESFLSPLHSGGGYVMSAAFTTGGSNDPASVIAKGTKTGVLEALREWQAYSEGDNNGLGLTNASFSGGVAAARVGGGLRDNRFAALPSPGGSAGAASSDIGRSAVTKTIGGGSVHALGAGTDVPAGRGGVPATVASAWRAAGMSDIGIAGILGNIQQESAFNPRSRHPDQPHFGGEAHFAHGLYQEGGTEWNHYAAWLQKYHPGADWRDPRLQSVFAAENLKKNYPRVWAALQRAHSPEEAARIYERGYEKPAPRAANEIGRERAARRFFGRMPNDNAVLQHAMPQTSKIQGGASVDIRLHGFPRGTRTSASSNGVFGEVTLSRGRTMVPAGD